MRVMLGQNTRLLIIAGAFLVVSTGLLMVLLWILEGR